MGDVICCSLRPLLGELELAFHSFFAEPTTCYDKLIGLLLSDSIFHKPLPILLVVASWISPATTLLGSVVRIVRDSPCAHCTSPSSLQDPYAVHLWHSSVSGRQARRSHSVPAW